jgi:RNA polymerase-binding transcription factor DksA
METETYKQNLEQLLTELTNDLADLGIKNPESAADWVATPGEVVNDEADPNLAADTNEEWAKRRATLALLETRYNNVKRALAKIDAGTYGTCEVSGEPIEPERLAANPAARTCLAHKDDENTLPA